MRLLLKLVPKKSHAYVNDYHYHLQAAIYSLIREGGLPSVHEKRGYKFFCFSNIFPYGEYEEGVERNLLVSSPSLGTIEAIQRASLSRMKSKGSFFVGEQQFRISSVSRPFAVDFVGPEVTVRSATPIVMRIPRARYADYGIKPKVDYEYVFWRETFPLDAFVKQLLDNIAKKWRDYSADNGAAKVAVREEVELLPQIIQYKFVKTVSKPITVKQRRQLVIGSLWEIKFAAANHYERRMLEFALDCGFGERNSLGFGFVNTR